MSQPEFVKNVVDPIVESMYTKLDSHITAVRGHVGQIFIYDPKAVEIANLEAGMTKEQSDEVEKYVHTRLLEKQSRFVKTNELRAAELDSIITQNNMKNAYKVGTFSAIENLKREWIAEAKKYTKNANLIGGLGSKTGVQIGHGDLGVASAGVAGLRGIRGIEEEINKTTDPETRRVLEKILADLTTSAFNSGLTVSKGTNNIPVQVTHDMVLDEKGNIRKSYSFILNFQDSITNKQEGDMEKKALGVLRAIITDNVVNLRSSKSLKESIEGILIYNLLKDVSKKNLKYRGASPLKKISVSNKAKRVIKTKTSAEVHGMKRPTGIVKQISAARTGPPINLVALINAKLPEEIRKRMTYPRLQWRTGRFAGSVRALSAEATRNGGVTVGYTYQRNPYELFEPGRSSLATPARDPKQLIDLSIRAIAQQYVQGRFYTRRM